jgi:glutathionylspermidine synthase
MSLEVVDRVVKDDNLLSMFSINKDLWPMIKRSWQEGKMDFQGRFDFAWDGVNPPKMLEYNADTPSMMIESSVIQAEWFSDTGDQYTQSQTNMMKDLMEQALRRIDSQCRKFQQDRIGFITVNEDQEMTT